MSAVAGILHFAEGGPEPGWIGRLTAAMATRAPDGQAHWARGRVALGHGMLRATPEARSESQPLAHAEAGLAIVWDGRLDNRAQLGRDLAAAGAAPRGDGDAELALQAYAAWGEAAPGRLLGDFAFAVWDEGNGRLFCARDAAGARPFYFTRNARFFACASEEEALLALPGVSRRPNAARIAYDLVPSYLGFDPAQSWLEDVWSLLPGHWMSVHADGSARWHAYWRPEPGEEARFGSDADCAEAFLEVFGEAVRCRLRGDGEAAAMVSGGLDSAALAAMARRLLAGTPGRALHAYSVVHDRPEECVESRCILSLTRGPGCVAHRVGVPSLAGEAGLRDLVDAAWSRPHPVDNSLPLPAMMCLAAGRAGHRVLLHGVCGDLALHVPRRYIAWHLRAGAWGRAWRECRGAARHHTHLRGRRPAALLLENAWSAFAPPAARRLLRALRGGPSLEGSLIRPEFAARLGVAEWLRDEAHRADGPLPGLQEAHARALLPPQGLASSLSGFDRVAGRHGVELRDPWADRRVVEFLLRLPLGYRVRDGWTKHVVRTAFAGDWEPEVRWRAGKEHLGWHFTARLMDESRALAARVLEEDAAVLDEYVDLGAARARFGPCLRDGGDEARREALHDFMALALWAKRIAGA